MELAQVQCGRSRRSVQCLSRRSSSCLAAASQADSVLFGLACQGIRHIGVGCSSRGVWSRYQGSSIRTSPVPGPVFVRQQSSCSLYHMLDAEPICPVGGQPTTRAILKESNV